jgi:hypothetical protein
MHASDVLLAFETENAIPVRPLLESSPTEAGNLRSGFDGNQPRYVPAQKEARVRCERIPQCDQDFASERCGRRKVPDREVQRFTCERNACERQGPTRNQQHSSCHRWVGVTTDGTVFRPSPNTRSYLDLFDEKTQKLPVFTVQPR